jgi:hypothetical protein
MGFYSTHPLKQTFPKEKGPKRVLPTHHFFINLTPVLKGSVNNRIQ